MKRTPTNAVAIAIACFICSCFNPLRAQIDFTPGLQYTFHRGLKATEVSAESRNYSHQFHASYGFRKHWNNERVPYFSTYFGYMEVQQYFASTDRMEGNVTFDETSSIKQRGAFAGVGFDIQTRGNGFIVLQPEFMALSSGDKAKTEFYSTSADQVGFRTKISYKTDDIDLHQETPVFRFCLNAGYKLSFRRWDIGLMYRYMISKPFQYNKTVWFKVTDSQTGASYNGSSNHNYKARLNGFSLSFRYIFLDWNY